MTCASPAALDPLGASASSAVFDGFGSVVPSVNRIGARNGAAISAEAATATRQSPASTSVTAPGLRAGSGKTARAIAAAVCVGSPLGTRVVFFVAVSGKPRFSFAWLGGASSAGCAGSSERTSRPQPSTASATKSTRATRHGAPERGIRATLAASAHKTPAPPAAKGRLIAALRGAAALLPATGAAPLLPPTA